MKNKTLIFSLTILLSSISIGSFAQTTASGNGTNSCEPTNPIKHPIHRAPRISYINGYMDNGMYTLTFAKAFDNVEINVYHNDILVQQEVASFTVGQTYSIDFERYGEGEYTISVCENGNNIYYSVEKCDK